MPHRTDISFLLLAAAIAACGPTPAARERAPDVRTERMAALDRIAAACRVPRSTLVLVGEDELHFRPAPEEDYERVECVLRGVAGANIPLRNIGTVGNEAPGPEPAPEAENAPPH